MNRLVQIIILLEHLLEERKRLPHNDHEQDDKHRDDGKEDPCKISAKDKRHDRRKDDHNGAPYGNTDNHHVRHLQVPDIRRHTRNERGRRELVNVLEGKCLNVVEHILPDIFGKPRGCPCTRCARKRSGCQGNDCHCNENAAVHPYLSHIDRRRTGLVDYIDELRDNEGNETFQNNFDRDKNGRKNGGRLIFPNTFGECFQQNNTSD